MSDHVLRNPHVVVDLAVVDLKDEAHEVGKDRRTACLRLDRQDSLSSSWSNDGEAVCILVAMREDMIRRVRKRTGRCVVL